MVRNIWAHAFMQKFSSFHDVGPYSPDLIHIDPIDILTPLEYWIRRKSDGKKISKSYL